MDRVQDDVSDDEAALVEPAAGGGIIFMPPCLCWRITNEIYRYGNTNEIYRGACEWLLQITVDG
jgi:hypothetical protein